MLVRSLIDGDIEGLGRSLYNRLEEPAREICPDLLEAKSQLEAAGALAGVAMTGSGSALFGLCRPGELERARRGIAALELGDVYGVRSLPHGVHVQPA
jgi:4-diphosphocytidyl-2C-methyl-D-erythritol kinase